MLLQAQLDPEHEPSVGPPEVPVRHVPELLQYPHVPPSVEPLVHVLHCPSYARQASPLLLPHPDELHTQPEPEHEPSVGPLNVPVRQVPLELQYPHVPPSVLPLVHVAHALS